MGTFLGGSIWIIAVVGGLFAIPGLWLTWQMVKLAVEAEFLARISHAVRRIGA